MDIMYPSNSNTANNDINPNSRIEDLISSSCSLFHFPSPYNIHYEDDDLDLLQQLHDILHQQQPPPLITNDQNNMVAAAQEIINVTDSSNNNNKKKKFGGTEQQIPRKRTCKKDRHSKINTANGPRDRRMRLSLDVARKFFGLQDMLGFDKASKTVEWLLTKSKLAIEELTRGFPHQMKHSSSSIGANSASSTSECEVLSGIDESASIATKVMTSCSIKEKEKKIRGGVRKAAFHPLAKESREKARAIARERTREKKRQQLNGDHQSKHCTEAINHDLNRLGPLFEVLANEVEEPSFREQREEIIGDTFLITGNWSPSTSFNYQHDSGISHEHQLTDFQFYGKPWEGYI